MRYASKFGEAQQLENKKRIQQLLRKEGVTITVEEVGITMTVEDVIGVVENAGHTPAPEQGEWYDILTLI